ncbi:hypothetical protein TcasGA2_TC011885 [Tribolium castaneum]|uniref:Uncharacterized protein n=1 Tax=Tribolium castaneum TaxID=7070 RepID=D6WZ81_TRICA|nr:hypothetical protein TcasGA2_TC011885 [Tribolium castaneum]
MKSDETTFTRNGSLQYIKIRVEDINHVTAESLEAIHIFGQFNVLTNCRESRQGWREDVRLLNISAVRLLPPSSIICSRLVFVWEKFLLSEAQQARTECGERTQGNGLAKNFSDAAARREILCKFIDLMCSLDQESKREKFKIVFIALQE